MNIWNIRHQGAPTHTGGQTAQQILEGVVEGFWEPDDEVMGPGDSEWRSLEAHPQFAEAMSEIEPPEPPAHPDQTTLDMNPLIDVALVLLIFFILTTTYSELRKMYPPPNAEKSDLKDNVAANAPANTIKVVVSMESGQPVITVMDEVIAEKDLQAKFEFLKETKKLNSLAVEMDKAAPWKTFMTIQDAAAGAKISETLRIERVRDTSDD